MAKELIWSEDDSYVCGWASDFTSKSDFSDWVKKQYEDGDITLMNIQVQPCISTNKTIPAESVVPLNVMDFAIENYYTADVCKIDGE